MGDLVRFPLVLREPEPPRRGRKLKRPRADFRVFPHHRRLALVKKHASAIRGKSIPDRERYLDAALAEMCAELAAFGVDCRDCQDEAIIDLAEAIAQQLVGPHYRLKIRDAR